MLKIVGCLAGLIEMVLPDIKIIELADKNIACMGRIVRIIMTGIEMS